MRVALAYDLRKDYIAMGLSEEQMAEFDSEETIECIEKAISALGHEVVRAGNIYELARRLLLGERWELVFNIAEGLYGRSREAQVPALLEAFDIPYTFSDPLTLSLCLDKPMAKAIVRQAGVPTTEDFVINFPEELDGIEAKCLSMGFPLFVKPAAEGTGKGITPASVVHDVKALKRRCELLLAAYGQPVLVETYLPGREFTAGVLGTGEEARVAGVLEVELLEGAEPCVYSFMNKELCEERVGYSLVEDGRLKEEVSGMALKAYRALGCRDAGRVDFRADGAGLPYFLEINPLAGLHPTHSDLPMLCQKAGIGYQELISGIIDSALRRRGFSPSKAGARAGQPE